MDKIGIDVANRIIHKISRRYLHKFDGNPIYDYDDLVSEGWTVLFNCIDGYNDQLGIKFTTYLFTSISNRFRTLLRNNRITIDPSCDCESFPYPSGQDNLLMLKQAVSAMSEVSRDFATMIVEEVPKELLNYARRISRKKKIAFSKNGEPDLDDSKIVFTKTMIEDYFGIKIKDMREIFNKYV